MGARIGRAPGVAFLAFVLAITWCPRARADEPASRPTDASPKRALPDYDGRGPEPATAADVALWVPRVLLSPLYLVTEYAIRWPLSIAVPAAEHADLPRKVYDFFAFGPDHKAGFAPVGYFDFGFNPSIGVYAFWNDAGFKGDDWHAHVEAWPTGWVAGSLTDRIEVDARHALQLRFEGVRRPDHVFYGLGPDVPQSNQSRYGEDRFDAGARYEWRFWRASRLEMGVGARAANIYDGHYGGDPSLTQEAATQAFALPPGFGQGYAALYNRGLLVVDTRAPASVGRSGIRAELQAEQGSDVRGSPASGWIRYGGSAGAALDLNQRGRVVTLSVVAQFADPLGPRPVPFTELASLGGDGPMRGYYPGRLVDRSAAAVAAHYVWPVGPWLGGSLEAAVGNVFDEHLQGFRPGRTRFSSDVGVSTLTSSDYPIELTFGLGSETFERGGRIDSFRASLSVDHGF
jgi:hypothetical protein